MHEAIRPEGFTFYQVVQLCRQHELFEEELPTSETARKANTKFSKMLKGIMGVNSQLVEFSLSVEPGTPAAITSLHKPPLRARLHNKSPASSESTSAADASPTSVPIA